MKRNVNQKYKTNFLQQFKENIYIVLYYNVFFKYHIIVIQWNSRNHTETAQISFCQFLNTCYADWWCYPESLQILKRSDIQKIQLRLCHDICPMKFLNSLYQLQS